MNELSKRIPTGDRLHALLLGLVPVAAVLVFVRVSPINPSILGDEFLYKQQALEYGLYESSANGDFGNYLFNLFFSSVQACGPSFYSCTKLLNVLFLVLGAYFVYLTARLLLSKNLSAFVFVLTIVSPVSAYSSFFMPEMLYFAMGSGFIFYVIRYLLREKPGDVYLAGAFLGLALLTKPHGLLLLPAIVLLAVFGLFVKREMRITLDVFKIFALAFVVRMAGGFLIAGTRSLDLFADYLGDRGEGANRPVQSESTASRFEGAVNALAQIFPGQILLHTIGAVFAIGFALIGAMLFLRLSNREESAKDVLLLTFLGSLLATLVFLIIGFSAWVTAIGDDHSTRLLARYYEWVYPFYLVIGFAGFARLKRENQIPRFLPASLAIFGAVITSVYVSEWIFTRDLKLSDTQFFGGVVGSAFTYFAPLALVLGLLAITLTASSKIVGVSGLVAISSVVVLSTLQATATNINFRGATNSTDVAGQFANHFIGDAAFGKDILVVGPNRFDISSAAFWIDYPGVQVVPVPVYSAVFDDLVDNRVNWVLALEGATYVGPAEVAVRGVGFTLSKVGDADVFYPSRISPNASINLESSIILTEPWGVWLSKDESDFSSSLSNFTGQLVVTSRVLDPERQSNHALALEFGESTASKQLVAPGDGSQAGQAVFEFENADLSNFTIAVEDASLLGELGASFSFQNGKLLGLESIRVIRE